MSSLNPNQRDLPPFIAGFWSNITLNHEKSLIAFAEKNKTSSEFNNSKACVSHLLYEGFGSSMAMFDPTHFLFVTWKNVTHYSLVTVRSTVINIT